LPLTPQPLYTFANGEEIATGGVNHVYAPIADKFGFYGYGA
jgi:hypothetical protein